MWTLWSHTVSFVCIESIFLFYRLKAFSRKRPIFIGNIYSRKAIFPHLGRQKSEPTSVLSTLLSVLRKEVSMKTYLISRLKRSRLTGCFALPHTRGDISSLVYLLFLSHTHMPTPEARGNPRDESPSVLADRRSRLHVSDD